MHGFHSTNLPPELRILKEEIEAHARAYGLDFYETIFEVIDADDLNEIAAYGGFPTRYPHWSFGMQYEELRKSYDYGLSKIYEMVINNNPCYAYLMRCNNIVDQKLVMAHVYGHCDFFKNNLYFAHTSRKMMDEMANHGARIRDYVEKFGEDEVESFMDRCMSIDDLSIFTRRPSNGAKTCRGTTSRRSTAKTRRPAAPSASRARTTWMSTSIRPRSFAPRKTRIANAANTPSAVSPSNLKKTCCCS
jgi:spore cortex formation protein SpoVR/YcgB (stage V sporulation)